MSPPVPSKLTRALAGALEAAIDPVQAAVGRPVILACRWCGKRSNPRGTVDSAVRDLDEHLATHAEWVDVLVAAWDGTRQELVEALDELAAAAAG